MALHADTLRTRSLTAAVFVMVMLTGLFWNYWSFVALFTIIHFGCWYEFVKLVKKIYGRKYLLYCLSGLIYITIPVLMMVDLRSIDMSRMGVVIPCMIIFSIWINDTMAYIVGSMIGKTPFSKISPKKTWEGTIGGGILCVVIIGLLGYFIPATKSIPLSYLIIIASICAVFGTLGDLFESKLKRMSDVKDSGTIMPGHGGFLDRFDSLLVATPFVWIYIKILL